MKSARIGVAIGSISVVFSTLCFLVMPVFTASLILSIASGVPSGLIALSLKARRTALVAFAFAPVPLCGFLLLEHAAHFVGSGYIAFLALGVAILVAAWAVIDYSRSRRGLASAAS